MKKFMFLAVAVLGLVSCEEIIPSKIEDKPEINFYEDEMTAEAVGAEEFIIPLESTGLDAVTILSEEVVLDYWTTKSQIGENVAEESWIEIVEIIEEYTNGTRALAKWDSAIVVRIKANDKGAERSATISARSFTKSDTITITQLSE